MRPILIVVISVFTLLSCGNSEKEAASKKVKFNYPKKENSTAPEKPKSTTPAVVVDSKGVANILITSNDVMKFNVKKIAVKSGQKIKLTLKHTGKLDKQIMGHNVVILKSGVKLSAFAAKAAASKDNDYIPEGTTEVLAYTKMIGGGETATIEFTAPEVGVYDFICSFPAHFAMMKGKFVVE